MNENEMQRKDVVARSLASSSPSVLREKAPPQPDLRVSSFDITFLFVVHGWRLGSVWTLERADEALLAPSPRRLVHLQSVRETFLCCMYASAAFVLESLPPGQRWMFALHCTVLHHNALHRTALRVCLSTSGHGHGNVALQPLRRCDGLHDTV
ncbi:hypothetical protein BCR34DRAFT_557047 [Clohesyomyces aquaticus]|uniref:Uncharacterized protein n=1 Tax=Clohesyomyces aquaticus TaxID=1231657 RepID=A0A1Y2A298_9PLEO|nr:hypothetical protein BCR34DRAFT_557047 [Clohesyomyces aquaticus]